MNKRIAFALAAFALVLLIGAMPLKAGQCGYPTPQAGVTTGISQINYVVYNVPASALNGALAIWSDGCLGAGTSYPSLSSSSAALSGPAILNINVVFQPGTSSSQSCGESFLRYDTSGALVGGSIAIFEYQIVNGVQSQCNSLSNFDALIAHEIGHSLGLDDQYTHDPNNCLGAIMSRDPRYVFSDECQIVQATFQTPAEAPPPPPPPPAPIGGCETTDCGSAWNPEPLVLDLNGDGVNTTGTESMVWFDLDGNGMKDHITWTNGRTMEGFLWVNLTGKKNRVDNGSELFGIGTVLPNGTKAKDGFEALAMYDDPKQGGNGDGVIDAKDAVWDKLRIWIDENHNGICEEGEVSSIHKFRIEGISLAAVRGNYVDPQGNGHYLHSRYWRRDGKRVLYYDIDGLTFQGEHH